MLSKGWESYQNKSEKQRKPSLLLWSWFKMALWQEWEILTKITPFFARIYRFPTRPLPQLIRWYSICFVKKKHYSIFNNTSWIKTIKHAVFYLKKLPVAMSTAPLIFSIPIWLQPKYHFASSFNDRWKCPANRAFSFTANNGNRVVWPTGKSLLPSRFDCW